MNIQKTNKLGLFIAKQGFVGKGGKYPEPEWALDTIMANTQIMKHKPNAKIIRVSKGIMDACKMIDIGSIKENIDQTNFDFQSLFILLDNDKSGVIKVERFGSDISFLMMSNLNTFGDECMVSTYNSYSFTSKSFSIEQNEEGRFIKFPHAQKLMNFENSVFVVQLLCYLIYGEITEKHLPPKAQANVGFTRFLNNSKLNITFCDTLWKQRINVDGFKVRGHFRLQPCGEKREKRKLIWIEEFEKQGYNRKATVEMQRP